MLTQLQCSQIYFLMDEHRVKLFLLCQIMWRNRSVCFLWFGLEFPSKSSI